MPLILVKHVIDGEILETDLPLVGGHKLPELERYLLQEGDTVVTRVGAVGRSSYVSTRQAGWMISGQMLRIRLPKNQHLNARFLAQALLDPGVIYRIESHAVGSTRPSLNTKLLRDLRLIVPPAKLQRAFSTRVVSLDSLRDRNSVEMKNLVSVRDTLLPRLLFGEAPIRGGLQDAR